MSFRYACPHAAIAKALMELPPLLGDPRLPPCRPSSSSEGKGWHHFEDEIELRRSGDFFPKQDGVCRPAHDRSRGRVGHTFWRRSSSEHIQHGVLASVHQVTACRVSGSALVVIPALFCLRVAWTTKEFEIGVTPAAAGPATGRGTRLEAASGLVIGDIDSQRQA